VRRRAPPNLPGHRHRGGVRQGRHGRALGRDTRSRGDDQRGRAPRLPGSDNKLRASIVADPAFKRGNTRDNTPAVIHTEFAPGEALEITVAAKGGGSENKSMFAMLNPSDSVADWVLDVVPEMGAGWCPPGMLGVGIGGSAEKAMLLAKKSLMDPIDMHELIARGPNSKIEELRLEIFTGASTNSESAPRVSAA
jgi:tartrate/fumarate subfamily iron-sulfur-dependent hydro-lyase alpha chain